MLFLDAKTVETYLPLIDCIDLMRSAMKALSTGETHQILRQILPVAGGLYGIMGGASAETYGSKLISVTHFPGVPSHQGVVLLFDPATGTPDAVVDAASVTAIRTAAASAMATDALARPDAMTVAILGTGEQAWMHGRAMAAVRRLSRMTIWGRDAEKAEALAQKLSSMLDLEVTTAATVPDATHDVDIICTTTSAAEPVLLSNAVCDGTHINAVGSSRAGPRELDDALICRARYFGDSRESVLSQGAEFIHARTAGLLDDQHFLGEIGEILAGACAGRTSPADITIYKSLGHIVQDLAAAKYAADAARAAGAGAGAGQTVRF